MSLDIATEPDLYKELAVDSNAAAALFLDARSANQWSPAEITEETLQAVYALTKMGPTAMNIQPMRIMWVRSPSARERLVAHMSEGNKVKTLAAPMVAVLSFTTEWHELLPTTAPHMTKMMTNFAANAETRRTMATTNAHLQAGYFIVAARAAGLAAGPMTGFDAAAVDNEFNANSGHQSFMVVNLGRPSDVSGRARLPRLDFNIATVSL